MAIATADKTPPGYYWKVVYDPTRTEDYPGDFYGGCFRICDVYPPSRRSYEFRGIWPDGIIFQNIKTGEKVVIRNQSVQRLAE